MEEGEGEQIETAPWGGEYPQEATEDGAPAPEWTTVSSETGEPYDANAVLVESSWASPDSLQQEQENDWAEAPSLQYGNQRNGDGTLNQNDDVDVSERADGQHLTLEEEIPVPAEERLNEDFTEESEELNLSLGQKDDVADQQGSFTSDDATDTRHTMGFINVATSPAVPEPANTFISTANGIEEVVEWLELLDPDQGALYYFAPHSGEIRWEAPTESTAYIRLCASGGELNKDIMFESAATSHETGVPIALIKDQNMQPEGARNVGDEGNLVSNEGKSLLWENETKEEETLHPQVHEPQWVEVYDPVTQHQYYYSPRTNTTRWDVSELPGGFIDGSKAAAAISIQAMSRGHAARRQVQELREKKHQHKRLHPIQEISLIEADTEFEFEAVCRREMITEELLQLSRGDRFWGVDIHDSEVLQLHIEKELMAKGVSTISQEYPRVYTLQQPTPTIRSSYYLAFEEDDEKMDTERLQQALQEESDAREAMFREESKQCQNADTFWGIQAEELRQTAANISMALEEEASRRFAEDALDHALSTAWEAEIQQSIANEIATHGEQEQRMQGRYLSWFYGQSD
ncbi:hypothetical protein PHYBOEH_005507 [Phytophthora boehmeriae]|uniref:WW domain-containing protein n=1 Tax=Phytophthora boehmeriae TaxID=109152 RepID=A0A8T1X9Q4_9STRA|nr:hypothetical protein PHYBOEH_005507 [Phytophthora boehmeriae]